MNMSEILEAKQQAQATLRMADEAVQRTAILCANRLRASNVDGWTLRDLKRELQDFDSRTREWKK